MIYCIHAWWLDNVYTKFIHSHKKREALSVSYEYGLRICFMFRNNFLSITTLWRRTACIHCFQWRSESLQNVSKCFYLDSDISKHKKNHLRFKTIQNLDALMRENSGEKVPATKKLFCCSYCSNLKQRNLNFLQLLSAHAYLTNP